MYLLKKTIKEFVNNPGETAKEVKDNFEKLKEYSASPSEINSWVNSYPEIAKVLSRISNNERFLIYFEFYMPGSSARADLIIIGKNKEKKRVAIIIELKQWDAKI